MASPAGRSAADAGRGPEEGWGWGRWGACRGRRRPPPAPGLSPGPPGRLRPRRHAELSESPSFPRGGGGGAAWAPGGGRRAAGRGEAGGCGPSRRGGRRPRPERIRPGGPATPSAPLWGVLLRRDEGRQGLEGPQCSGEGRARPEPAGPQEVEGPPGQSPCCNRAASSFS